MAATAGLVIAIADARGVAQTSLLTVLAETGCRIVKISDN
jgi:hypothetical protein